MYVCIYFEHLNQQLLLCDVYFTHYYNYKNLLRQHIDLVVKRLNAI